MHIHKVDYDTDSDKYHSKLISDMFSKFSDARHSSRTGTVENFISLIELGQDDFKAAINEQDKAYYGDEMIKPEHFVAFVTRLIRKRFAYRRN